MSGIIGLDGQPMGLDEFKRRFNALLTGKSKPTDIREELLKSTMNEANAVIESVDSPLTAILVSWWSWVSISNWVQDILTPEGKRAAAKIDDLLAQMATRLLFDAWNSMDGIEDANGGANAKKVSDTIPSKAPIRIVS